MQDKDDKDDYAWWRFIEEYLPGYYSSSDVLLSNIYGRFLNNDDAEDMYQPDLDDIERKFGGDRKAMVAELVNIDTELFRRALTAFYEKRFLP